MDFGAQVRQWRQERGLGLRKLAKEIGVSPPFLSRMESGKGSLPGEETLCRMARIFEKNPDTFLAMAGKVSSDVHSIIIRQPAFSPFIRKHADMTAEQWDTLWQETKKLLPLKHPDADRALRM